ncbi:MAG: methylated-DNA--[protein]-cysteine S-methyltransferase [Defluviitaleaceae bacterium]|nr:methylated-DNA--[protein]-cysteine S-methyltransferase [Defluviitaleaceae bacterium]
MILRTTYKSPVGIMTLASNGKELIGLWIEDQKYHGTTLYENMVKNDNLPIFEQTKKWLDTYFEGKKPDFNELPLAPIGGEFRQSIWKILCEIPYGKVVTYGDIAKKIAKQMGKKSMSSQAVGGAVGHNPIGIIIPCHRVVGSNGSLTGYAGGIDIKIKLLELEEANMTGLFVPKKGTALYKQTTIKSEGRDNFEYQSL